MIIKATKELEDGSVGLIGVPQDIAFPGDNYILLDNQDSKKGKQFAVDDIWKFQLLDGTPGEYLSITRPGEKVMLITDSLGIDEVHIGDKIIYMGMTANSPSKISSDKPTKKRKKTWYKKWWIWIIIALAIVGLGTIVSGSDSSENSSITSISQISTTHKPSTTTSSSTLMSANEYCNYMTEVMAEKGADVTMYEKDSVIYCNTTASGISQAARIVKYGGDSTYQKQWNDMKQAAKETSISMAKSAKKVVGPKYTTIYSVVNDQDSTKTLLSYSNGKCIYDYTQE